MLPAEVSSRYHSYTVCIELNKYRGVLRPYISFPGHELYFKWNSNIDILELIECPGLLTARRNQHTTGICTNQNSPLEASNLYLTFKKMVPGRYYFDCHLLDGSTVTREVVICKLTVAVITLKQIVCTTQYVTGFDKTWLRHTGLH